MNLGSGYEDFFDKNICEIISISKSLANIGIIGIRNPKIIDQLFIDNLKNYLDGKIKKFLYDKKNFKHTLKIFNEYLKWHNRNSAESCKIDWKDDKERYIVVSHYPEGIKFISEYEYNGWLYSFLLLSNLSNVKRKIISPRNIENRYRFIKVKSYEIDL